MTVVEQSSPVQPVETKMVRLGDIAKFINGAAFKPTDWNDEGARIIRIQNLNDPKKPYNRTTRIVGPQFHVSPGDLLVSWSASLGVFVWDQPDVGLLNQHIFRVIPDHGLVTDDYLRHMLVGALADMEAHLHGATMKHVNRKEFLAVRIPLPPLPEQRRIAAILDKADHLRTQRRQALAHLEALTQSIFNSMFGDPNRHDRWDSKPLASLGLIVTGNTPPRANLAFFGDEIEWIKTDNINTPSMYLTDAHEGLSSEGKARGRYVPAGSILMTCIAGSARVIGNVAVADREVAFNQQINAFIPHEGPPEYWYQLLVALQPSTQMLSSGGMKGMVSKSALATLDIPMTPLELQQTFARRVAGVERLKEEHRAQLAELDTLFASLQHRAFTGKL